MRGSGTALQDVLFCIGAAPVGLFTIGQMGRFARRGDPADQLSRPQAGTLPDRQREIQDRRDLQTIPLTGVNWILAGAWVCLVVILM